VPTRFARVAAGVLRLALCCRSVDQFPQLIQSFARYRRDRQHGIVKNGFEFLQRTDPSAAREFVNLGRDHPEWSVRLLQPFPRQQIALKTRVSDIDQEQGSGHPVAASPALRRQAASADARKVLVDQMRKTGSVSPRVAVTWQIHEEQRWRGTALHAVDVRQARFSGRSTRPRDALPRQRVDQARFADIRPANERHRPRAIEPSPAQVTEDVLAGKLRIQDLDPDYPGLFQVQDNVALAGQGRITDRSQDWLGQSDKGIILLRRIYERELGALADGRPLKDWKRPAGKLDLAISQVRELADLPG